MKIPLARILSVAAIPVIVLTGVWAAIYFNQGKRLVTLPDYGAVPVFQLVDASGLRFTSSELIGKPWMASFIFTRCQNQTPLMLAKMKKLSNRFPDLKFVSVTVDPDFDKPQVLTEFIGRGNGPKNWSFLTGSQTEIENAAEAFKMSAPKNPHLHSTRFVLIDSYGQIRGYYDSQSREQLSELEVDIQGLIDNMGKMTAS